MLWTVAVAILTRAVEQWAVIGDSSQTIHFMIAKQRARNTRITASILIGALNLFPAIEKREVRTLLHQSFNQINL